MMRPVRDVDAATPSSLFRFMGAYTRDWWEEEAKGEEKAAVGESSPTPLGNSCHCSSVIAWFIAC